MVSSAPTEARSVLVRMTKVCWSGDEGGVGEFGREYTM
jgi:hypothetical protein